MTVQQQNSQVLVKAGLKPISNEDHEEITTLLSAVAEGDVGGSSNLMDAAPSDPSPGTSVDNVFYINFHPEEGKLSDEWLARLRTISDDYNLSAAFLDGTAKKMAADKVAAGQLNGNDPVAYNNYVAKAINALVMATPWITTTGVATQSKSFQMGSDQFHQALVTEFTKGLNLPTKILDDLEGFLTNTQSLIANGAKQSADVKDIYIFAVIYVKDDVLQTVRPYIRTIYFKPSASLVSYSAGKNDTKQNVDVDIQYAQADGMFNENIFVNAAKAAIATAQGIDIPGFVNGTIDVSV